MRLSIGGSMMPLKAAISAAADFFSASYEVSCLGIGFRLHGVAEVFDVWHSKHSACPT
jgi:hypothetical protein